MDLRQPSLFFGDGRKTIDFVLVYKASSLSPENGVKLETYLDNLLRTGLDLEVDTFSGDRNTTFVKIHGTKYTIQHYADICDIELVYKSVKYRPNVKPTFRFMATPLTLPNPADPVYQRAPESVSGSLPTDITSAEKILVIYAMLNRTKFGLRYSEFGVKKLLNDGVFTDAFPIHEGTYIYSDYGTLTDRQLLARYWGAPKYWYKEQPLNLIEKYYGAEIAFYFAWLGFYVRMLAPVAILSILCVLYGVITMYSNQNTRSEEICESDLIMCPRCRFKQCSFEKLSNSCLQSHLSYISDNPACIVFAIIISFWSTFFMELWERKECVLQLQWNLTQLEYDASMRPEYIQNAVYHRYSTITGEKEPYTPRPVKAARYFLSSVSVILMLGIMVLVTVEIMIYRLWIYLVLMKEDRKGISSTSARLIATVTGSLMSAIFILIFKLVYGKIAMALTKMENHRTQHHFDNGYIYKTYALAFTNNYSAVFYIAFFKGRLFTHPGDMTKWTHFGAIGADTCSPTGCLIDLSIQLFMIMMVQLFVNNYVQLISPRLVALFQRRKNRLMKTDLPAYEREYLMAPTNPYFLINDYMDMVIQYGFVVFFVAGFPLLPVFALLNNFVDLRVDSYNMTRKLRRPVPNKVPGLGAWQGILQAVTYVGVVTNALVIAFTSDFVPREIYANSVDYSLKGFVNTTISAFKVEDIEHLEGEPPTDICFYPGKRYPPEHPQRYQYTTDFWYMLAMRFLAVVVFEHVVMILKGIIAYGIPDVPSYVAEQIAFKERENKEIRMKVLNEAYMDERRRTGVRTSIVEPIDLDPNS